jgi:hypothetical protein
LVTSSICIAIYITLWAEDIAVLFTPSSKYVVIE